MFLKVVRHNRVLVGGSFVTLPTHVDLARVLQVDLLEELGRKWQVSDAARDGWSPGQTCRECGASWGASYGLSGTQEKRHCWLCQLILSGWWHHGEDRPWALFGYFLTVEGAFTSWKMGIGSQKEGVSIHQLHGSQQGQGSPDTWQGCPSRWYPAPGVPLIPGRLHISSILLPPSASTMPTNKKII